MRLLALTNAYPPSARGGYGEVCGDVMGRLAERGHDVVVLTARGTDDDEHGQDSVYVHEGIEVRRTLTPALGAWRRPARAIRATRHDVAAVEKALAEGVDAALVWHMRGLVKPPLTRLHDAGLPVLYMLHDRWVLYERPGSLLIPWARLDRIGIGRLRGGFARLVPGVDLRSPPISTNGIVCFSSEWLRDEYARRGWHPRRSSVIPDGVRSEPGVTPSRRRLPQVRLLFAGRLHPHKGLHVVLDALDLAGTQCDLAIAGVEDDARYAARLRTRSRSRNGVAWLGELPRAEVQRLLRERDALVYPSLEPESGQLGILEALAAGAVVISSAPGAPRELLEHEHNALLFEPGSAHGLAHALRRLAEDKELVRRLVAAGVETAARYSLEGVVSRIEQLIRTAVHHEHGSKHAWGG